MSTLTKEQIDALPEMAADAMAGPWFRNEENDVCIQIDGQHHAVCTDQFCYGSPAEKDANARLIALAPSLAATVIEQQAEIERLRGLLWYAWNEFNAIRARSGAPLDHYQMTTVSPEWWETMLEAFGEAIGDENQKPWPSPAARAALDVEP